MGLAEFGGGGQGQDGVASQLGHLPIRRPLLGAEYHTNPVGRYELREKIGEGSTASVWRSWDRFQERDVAIKKISKDSGHHRAEIGLNKLIDCQHIVQYLNHYETDQHILLVTEFYRGQELFELIASLGRHPRTLTEFELACIFVQILRGVLYMHKHGICHRDIKPSNVMFEEEVDLDAASPPLASHHLRIVDIGSAEKITARGLGDIRSSPYYTAPEVLESIKGGPRYGLECDMWSLGATLFTIAMGEMLPIDGDGMDASSAAKIGSETLAWRLRVTDEDFFADNDHYKHCDADPLDPRKENELFIGSELPVRRRCSTLFFEFLTGLLHPAPFQRLNARQALHHPWILATVPSTLYVARNLRCRTFARSEISLTACSSGFDFSPPADKKLKLLSFSASSQLLEVSSLKDIHRTFSPRSSCGSTRHLVTTTTAGPPELTGGSEPPQSPRGPKPDSPHSGGDKRYGSCVSLWESAFSAKMKEFDASESRLGSTYNDSSFSYSCKGGPNFQENWCSRILMGLEQLYMLRHESRGINPGQNGITNHLIEKVLQSSDYKVLRNLKLLSCLNVYICHEIFVDTIQPAWRHVSSWNCLERGLRLMLCQFSVQSGRISKDTVRGYRTLLQQADLEGRGLFTKPSIQHIASVFRAFTAKAAMHEPDGTSTSDTCSGDSRFIDMLSSGDRSDTSATSDGEDLGAVFGHRTRRFERRPSCSSVDVPHTYLNNVFSVSSVSSESMSVSKSSSFVGYPSSEQSALLPRPMDLKRALLTPEIHQECFFESDDINQLELQLREAFAYVDVMGLGYLSEFTLLASVMPNNLCLDEELIKEMYDRAKGSSEVLRVEHLQQILGWNPGPNYVPRIWRTRTGQPLAPGQPSDESRVTQMMNSISDKDGLISFGALCKAFSNLIY